MKTKEIYQELQNLAKEVGLQVRRGSGRFYSAGCTVNNENLIVLNSMATVDTRAGILARHLINFDLDDHFIKPAVREFIENSIDKAPEEKTEFELKVDYDLKKEK